MTTLSTKYFSFGNRRELNLSDIEDSTQALNNLLNNLDLNEGETFISEDLDVIRGLSGTDITPDTLYGLADIAVKETVINPITGNVEEFVVEPLITLKDRVDNIKVISGNIPAFRGGTGPSAKFFPSSTLNSLSDTGFSISDLYGTALTSSDYDFQDFWLDGIFEFLGSLSNTFTNQYGGIYWEGYFAALPLDSTITIRLETTGLCIIEYDPDEDDNWQVLNSIYNDIRTVTTSGSNSGTAIPLVSGDSRFVAIGDRIANTEITVTGVSNTGMTVSEEYVVSSSEEIILEKTVGLDFTRVLASLPIKAKTEKYKVRFTIFYPDTGEQVENHYAKFSYIGSRLAYPYLYKEKDLPPGELEIRTFLENMISPFQEELGESSQYQDFVSSRSVFAEYQPNEVSNSNFYNNAATYTLNCDGNSKVVRITGSSISDAINIEPGMYIVPSSANNDIDNSNLRIVNLINSFGSTSAFYEVNNIIANPIVDLQVRLLSPIGLVKWDYASDYVSGTKTLSIADTSLLRKDFIVHKIGSTTFNYIESVTDGTTVVLSDDISVSSGDIVMFFSNSGLIDASKDIFCQGVFGKVVASTVSSGNTVVVTDASDISNGQVVWLDGFIDDGTGKATVTNVSGTTISLSGTNTIQTTIISGTTLTFSPAGTTVNKEQCVIPLDTAPPFIGEEYGLSTNGKSIKSSNAAFTLEALTISFENALVTSGSYSNESYDRVMIINSGQFVIPLKLV